MGVVTENRNTSFFKSSILLSLSCFLLLGLVLESQTIVKFNYTPFRLNQKNNRIAYHTSKNTQYQRVNVERDNRVTYIGARELEKSCLCSLFMEAGFLQLCLNDKVHFANIRLVCEFELVESSRVAWE